MWDLIVVGLGAMGAATCWRAAARGARVLGIEQFGLVHDMGSSHGGSRVIRESYFEHPDYVPLLLATRPLWDELEAQSGIRCVGRVGMLFLGSPESMVLQGSLATARAHGIAHRLLDAGALRAQFPQFVVGSGALGLLEEGAGYAIPEHTIRAALVLAQGAGAVVAENTAVVEVRAAGGGVEVHTQHGVERGRRVVVAAGPWTSRLLGGLAPMLRVERHAMVWLEPARQAECHESRMPVWAVDEGAAGFYYGVPLAEGVPGPRGVKVGYHGPGPVVEPNTVERAVGAAEVAAFGEAVHRLVPAVSRRSVGAKVCLYTRSPDDHFIVGAAPDVPGAVVACGFSGHGFKFAPVMGEALAGLALDGGTALPVGFLGLDRLAAHG